MVLTILLHQNPDLTLAELPGTFGHAQRFLPLKDTVVGAHCSWKVHFDTKADRIPPTITEILCHSSNSYCGGNTNYRVNYIMPFRISLKLFY
jgi:hypothetical protein